MYGGTSGIQFQFDTGEAVRKRWPASHDSVHESELLASAVPVASRTLDKSHNRSYAMHAVSKIDPAAARTPALYQQHSTGVRRATYVDRAMGSVHMGTGICFLDAKGAIEPHLHSFEESFYVLEGSLAVEAGGKTHTVSAGNFGLIPTGGAHSWKNTGPGAARWLEMHAPQPRPAAYGRDTFFTSNGAAPDAAVSIGHFDETQLPRPGGPSQMEGFNPTTGVAIKMFVDRSFGATHQSLFLIQYSPGAKIDPHDHTFEESYFIVGGRVLAVALKKG